MRLAQDDLSKDELLDLEQQRPRGGSWIDASSFRRLSPRALMVVTSTSTREAPGVATWTGITFCEQ